MSWRLDVNPSLICREQLTGSPIFFYISRLTLVYLEYQYFKVQDVESIADNNFFYSYRPDMTM